jgi:hypothetical protein
LFSDQGGVDPDPAVALDPRLVAIVDRIGEQFGASMGAGVLVPAIAEGRGRRPDDLCDEAIVVYAVDKLKRPRRVVDPSRFLATDFRTRFVDTRPSPRMNLATELSQLTEAIDVIDAAHLALGHDGPLPRLHSLLIGAELLDEDSWSLDAVPEVWDVKPAQVKRWIEVVQRVHRDIEPYVKEARQTIGDDAT